MMSLHGYQTTRRGCLNEQEDSPLGLSSRARYFHIPPGVVMGGPGTQPSKQSVRERALRSLIIIGGSAAIGAGIGYLASSPLNEIFGTQINGAQLARYGAGAGVIVSGMNILRRIYRNTQL